MPALAFLPVFTMGQVGPLPKHPAHVSLVSVAREVRPGEAFWVALRFQMMPGWHIYWENPGESGQAPTVEWHLPKGWTAGPIEWPAPKRLDTAGTVTYTYEDEAWLLTKITTSTNTSPGPANLEANVKWLVCREGCIPDQASAATHVTVGDFDESDPNMARKFVAATQRLPTKLAGLNFLAKRQAGRIDLTLSFGATTGDYVARQFSKAIFLPADQTVEPSAPQPATKTASGLVLQLKVSSYAPPKTDRLRGLLVNPSGPIWGASAIAIDTPIQRTTS